jgi:hypothetical protein
MWEERRDLAQGRRQRSQGNSTEAWLQLLQSRFGGCAGVRFRPSTSISLKKPGVYPMITDFE